MPRCPCFDTFCAFLLSFPLSAAPSEAQLANLTCGSNSNWFSPGKIVFDEPKAKDDLANLNKTGLRHMRLYLSHHGFGTAEDPYTPLPETLEELSKAIQFAAKEGLAVIVNPYHLGRPTVGRQSPPQPKTPQAEGMVKLWGALAKHLSTTDPNMVFLEIASEPTHKIAADWSELQLACHTAIRAAAPNHVIIATTVTRVDGNRWDSIKPLTTMKPIPDDKTVYNFHFRSPFVFTHQGRDTADMKYLSELLRVPYPSSPDKVLPFLASMTDPVAMERITAYGEERWDRSRIRADIAQAAKWAQKNNVRLTCNEFGVYRRNAVGVQRIAYLKDVREIFEEFGIGWTVWSDSFGIFNRDKRPFTLDTGAAGALGLIAK